MDADVFRGVGMWADDAALDAAGRRLDERVRQHSAAHTARQILETTTAAHADLLRQITNATAETLGDDVSAQAIIDSYRSRLRPDPGSSDARR
ncbi:hypothetical protein [Micromonospora sp. NBC_00617]|uniref:hypothetical protein n=1 Tax=Micromonospora sp. NBC_00617 TaxID=2903587 RepID=UPI0030E53826